MVYTGIFCTEAEIIFKEGANVSTSVTEAMHNIAAAQAEGSINAATRYNWSDKFASLNEDVKGVLAETASNLAAIYSISYDMDAIGRATAESMINILRDAALRGISIIREIKSQTFMLGA